LSLSAGVIDPAGVIVFDVYATAFVLVEWGKMTEFFPIYGTIAGQTDTRNLGISRKPNVPLVPPAGIEPAHMASEANALSA